MLERQPGALTPTRHGSLSGPAATGHAGRSPCSPSSEARRESSAVLASTPPAAAAGEAGKEAAGSAGRTCRGFVYVVTVSCALRHSRAFCPLKSEKEGRLNRQTERGLAGHVRICRCLFKKTVKGNHPVRTIPGTNWPEHIPIMT